MNEWKSVIGYSPEDSRQTLKKKYTARAPAFPRTLIAALLTIAS